MIIYDVESWQEFNGELEGGIINTGGYFCNYKEALDWYNMESRHSEAEAAELLAGHKRCVQLIKFSEEFPANTEEEFRELLEDDDGSLENKYLGDCDVLKDAEFKGQRAY